MKLGTIVTLSLLISFILNFLGVYLKITHSAGADKFLIAGIIASIVFLVTAIYEVRTSKRINYTEKNMWTLAFIFFSSIAGLIYILIGRRRIASNY